MSCKSGSNSPLLRRFSTGSSRISTPGPTCRFKELVSPRWRGQICRERYVSLAVLLSFYVWDIVYVMPGVSDKLLTLVPPQPRRKAASWASSSPKPSIMPLTKGRRRLMAAPRRRDQKVGGWYIITGREDVLLLLCELGGEGEDVGGLREE